MSAGCDSRGTLCELTSTQSRGLIQLNWIPHLLNEEQHVANTLRAGRSEERRTGGNAETGLRHNKATSKQFRGWK